MRAEVQHSSTKPRTQTSVAPLFTRLWLSKLAQIFLAALLIGIAVVAVYYRAIDSPFIFDDHKAVPENPSVAKLWPLIGSSENPGPLNPPRDLPTSGPPAGESLVSTKLLLWRP